LLQVIVVDCRNHMMGRLASIIAKELMNGQKIVSISPLRRAACLF
jgi:large subunit ribosomal protein L13Ae